MRNAAEELPDFFAVAFVLSFVFQLLFFVAVDGQGFEVVDLSYRAAAEHFDVFFGQFFAAVGEVTDGCHAAVTKLQVDDHCIVGFSGCLHGCCRNGCDLRSGEEHRQVDEVAGFADDAPATRFGIVDPVVWRELTCVDAHVDAFGLTVFEQGFYLLHCRGKPSVKTCHQMPGFAAFHRFGIGCFYLLQLFFAHGQRFLDKHMLVMFDGLQHIGGMLVMAGEDENRIHLIALQHLFSCRSAK